jgi:hypothetical protein
MYATYLIMPRNMEYDRMINKGKGKTVPVKDRGGP